MTVARPIRPIDQNLNYAPITKIERIISDAMIAELQANKATLETQLSYDTQADIKALQDTSMEMRKLEKKSMTEKSAIILGQILALSAAIEERYATSWIYTFSNIKNYALYQHLQKNLTALLNMSLQPKVEDELSSEEIKESVETVLDDEETRKAKAELDAKLAKDAAELKTKLEKEIQIKLNFAKQQALIAFYNHKPDAKVLKLINRNDLHADLKAKRALANPGQEEKAPSTKVIHSSLLQNPHPKKTYTLRDSPEEAANIARNQRESLTHLKLRRVGADIRNVVSMKSPEIQEASLNAIIDIDEQAQNKALDADSTAFRQAKASQQMEIARKELAARQNAAKNTELFKTKTNLVKTVFPGVKEASPEVEADKKAYVSPTLTRR